MKRNKLTFLTLALALSILSGFAQPRRELINVIVAPDKTDWTYKTGERVKFSVAVLENGIPVKNAPIHYSIGPEKMGAIRKDSLKLPDGRTTLDAGTMKDPGFLRCNVRVVVNGTEYEGLATAGFDPADIRPTVSMPNDFTAFWDKAKDDLAAVPLDARMTLLPDRCTEKVNVYHVNMQNFRPGTRLYGILCVPKKEGKYPALLSVPGAGVRPYQGDIAMAERGIITLEIGIHGIPVNMETYIYYNLGAGALRDYPSIFLDDPDRFYYKRVYLGCVRANDFLVSLPQYDGTNLGVTGGSQGGALSIITAGLDPRVKYLGCYYPALCDVTGYLKGRAGGWPHYFSKENMQSNHTPSRIRTCEYYDVVNFARNLKAEGLYTWGFNDEVCPPTSMYAAYNVIHSSKSLHLALETGHWTYPEQREVVDEWLAEKLLHK